MVNLQKFTFHACVDSRSIMMLAPAQKMRSFALVDDDGVDLGMLEAQPLHRVGELDVDAEVVGVELEPVVGREARVFADVHRERGDRAVDLERPVPVRAGGNLEGDGRVGGVSHSS